MRKSFGRTWVLILILLTTVLGWTWIISNMPIVTNAADESANNNDHIIITGIRNSTHRFCYPGRNIEWNRLDVNQATADVDYAINLAKSRLDDIKKIPLDQVSFSNTILAMEYAEEELSQASSLLGHLDAVSNCDETTKVIYEILPKISEFSASIPLDQELWQRVDSYSRSKEANELLPVQKKLLKNIVDLFVDHGANLDARARARLLEISSELSKLCYKFGDNVLAARNAWEKFVTKDKLLGLPESMMKSMASEADKAGRAGEYKISLDDSCVEVCSKYLDDDDLRKEILVAHRNLCRDGRFSNQAIVNRILALEDEKARLLGNDSYSNFVLKHNMLKTKADVDSFLAKVYEEAKPQFDKDLTALRLYAKNFYAKTNVDGELTPWNRAYLGQKMKTDLYGFDREQLRPYFEINNVMNGLFKIVEELYGIKIIEKKTVALGSEAGEYFNGLVQVWDEDVKYYEIFESNGNFIGGFFADLYQRKNKHSGAWCSGLVCGGIHSDGKWHYPVGVICANVPKPTQGEPSLLLHSETEVIFHEFGHLMHLMFGKVDYPSLNGYHVAMDFVELPSQLMENFCWEPRSLALFAKHHISGELIPADLFNRLLASRSFMASLSLMGQLDLTVMDIELYGNYAKYNSCQTLDAVLEDVLGKYRIDYREKPPSIIYRFSHIFSGGYASEYYSYMWSEVLDADAFTLFKANGVIDRATGHLFRDKILSVGDSVDPLENFKFFVKREPDIRPFLMRRGCLQPDVDENKNKK